MLLHVIQSLVKSAFPVVLRLLLLIFVFHGVKYLLKQWKGLKRR